MSLLTFATRDAPPELRKELVDNTYNAHVRTTIDFPGEEPVDIEMRMRAVGEVHVAFVTTTPVTLVTPSDEEDLVYLSIAGGHGVHDSTGEDLYFSPGDVNVMRRDRKTVTAIAERSPCLSIAIPRILIADRITSIDNLWVTRSLADPAANLLKTYAMSLLGPAGDFSKKSHAVFSNHLVDLATLMFGANDDSVEHARKNGVKAARRQAVKADIKAHLRDPELSLGWLARRHGVSIAYLRALFYDEGTSFTDYVMAARLDYVHALLRDPQHGHLNIAGLALMAGFGDISWFNQVFRRRFGNTPSDARKGMGEDTRSLEP